MFARAEMNIWVLQSVSKEGEGTWSVRWSLVWGLNDRQGVLSKGWAGDFLDRVDDVKSYYSKRSQKHPAACAQSSVFHESVWSRPRSWLLKMTLVRPQRVRKASLENAAVSLVVLSK